MDYLAQKFEALVNGECSAAVFEREVLAFCRPSPERAWRALALLDQYFRRRRIAEDYCRHLRAHIGHQAMRLEGHTVEPEPPPPPHAEREPESPPESPVLPEVRADELLSSPPPVYPGAAPDLRQPLPEAGSMATAETAPQPPRRSGQVNASQTRRRLLWKRGLQTSPALGLAAVMLGVAASTHMGDPPLQRSAEEIPSSAVDTVAAEPESPAGPELISLSSDRYLVYPHQKSLEFKVERNSDGGDDARFVWWTQSSGAKSSADYIGTRRKLAAVPNGTASLTLQVPILSNPQRRHIEMFYVVIGKADGGADLGSIRRAAVFIMPADAG
jgi:hypothetical protein